MTLGGTSLHVQAETDPGYGLSDQTAATEASVAAQHQKTVPSAKAEIEIPPADYSKVPVRITPIAFVLPHNSYYLFTLTTLEGSPVVNEELECSSSGGSIPFCSSFEGSTGVYQLEVGRLYKLSGEGVQLDLHVEPGYELLIDGVPSVSARLFEVHSPDEETGYVLVEGSWHWLQVVKSRPEIPVGEAAPIKLNEILSWGASLGRNTSRSVFRHNGSRPVYDTFSDIHGHSKHYVHTPASLIGFIEFTIDLWNRSPEEVLDELKSYESINFPADLMHVPNGEVGGVKVFALKSRESGAADFIVKLTNHTGQNGPGGFDIEFRKNSQVVVQQASNWYTPVVISYTDGDAYRRYQFRVTSSTSAELTTYRADNLLRKEILVYANNQWQLTVQSGVDYTDIKRSEVAFNDVGNGEWEALIKQSGNINGNLGLSGAERKRFKRYSNWSVDIDRQGVNIYTQDRLIKSTKLSDEAGSVEWITTYAYYDDPDSGVDFLQLKSFQENVQTGCGGGRWAEYTYHGYTGIPALHLSEPELGLTGLRGKQGRLFSVRRPSGNHPLCPDASNDGAMTRYYYKGGIQLCYSDIVSHVIKETDGDLVTWISPFDFTSESPFGYERAEVYLFHELSSNYQVLSTPKGYEKRSIYGAFSDYASLAVDVTRAAYEKFHSETREITYKHGTAMVGFEFPADGALSGALYVNAEISDLIYSGDSWVPRDGQTLVRKKIFDKWHQLIRSETHLWINGGWVLIDHEDRQYVDHRLISIQNSRGEHLQRTYHGPQSPFYGLVNTAIDASGVVTTYTHDVLGRITSTSVVGGSVSAASMNHGIPSRVTNYTYDGSDRVLKVEVNGELKEVKRYDLTGNLVVHLDANGEGVHYDYSQLSSRIVSETKVWGIGNWKNLQNPSVALGSVLAGPSVPQTTITETFQDGRLYKTYGTSVVAEQHVYTRRSEAGNGFEAYFPATTYELETITTGVVNPLVTRIGRDTLGRVIFEEVPGSESGKKVFTRYYYEHDLEGWWTFGPPTFAHPVAAPAQNSYGGGNQISRKSVYQVTGSTLGSAMTADEFYLYDDLGRKSGTLLLVPSSYTQSDGTFADPVSLRRTLHEYGYVQDGGAWWKEERTKSLILDGDDSTWVTIALTRERLTGLGGTSGFRLLGETHTWGIGGINTDESPSVQAATVTKTEVDRDAKVSRTTVIQPGGRTAQSWSSHGLLLMENEPGGGSRRYEYEGLGRVYNVLGSRDVLVEQRVYAGSGSSKIAQIKSFTSDAPGLSVVKSFSYESGAAAGRVKTETDALGNTTHFEYDARDAILRTWGTKVYPVSYTYDEFGRKHTMTAYRDEGSGGSLFSTATWPSPSGGDVTTWNYDSNSGLLVSKVDAKSQATQYGYDAFNRRNARLLPNGKLKVTTFNAQTGEVFSEKYYKNATSLTDTSQPDTQTPGVFYSYNRIGQVEKVRDGTGDRTLAYADSGGDLRGLLHSETITVGSSNYVVEYSYDDARRRLSQLKHGLTPQTFHTVDFGYRTTGNVGALNTIQASGGVGELDNQTFTYGYLPNTSWVESITAGNFTHTRGYEWHREVVAMTQNFWGSTNLGYVTYDRDALGRISNLERGAGIYNLYSGGGLSQNFFYTSKGELKLAWTGTFAEPELPMKGRLINLAYDGQGNRKSLHVDGQLSHNYTPGPANEYTAVSYSNAVGMIAGMAEHPGRVVVGNELAERQGQYFYRDYSAGSAASWTMEKVFAAAEPPAGSYVQQYTTAQKEMYLPPASHTPSYDAAGNLLSDGWWTYEYDGENRLIRQASVVYHPDGRSRELLFNYDYLGRRVKKTVKAHSSDEETLSTTAFVYWDWHLIAELNVSWTGTVSRKRHYVWGLDKEGVRPGAGGVGGLLMVVDNVTNKTYLAMNDYIGNVIGLVDPDTGSTVAEYEYDPFGRPIRETGTYAAQNPIRFSSQYTDHETGLVYFGFRYYHPQWGRFLNRDPIEELGGENLYRFVSNDPVNRWDLVGLYSIFGLEFSDGGGVGGFFKDLGGYAGAAIGAAAQGAQAYSQGIDQGIYNSAAGLANAVANPIDTATAAMENAEALASRAINDPVGLVSDTVDAVAATISDPNALGQAVGGVVFDTAVGIGAGKLVSKLDGPGGGPDMCFVAGTLVSTENGFVSIEDIEPGQQVWSFNEEKTLWALNEVVQTFEREYHGELISITFGDEAVIATEEHPFYVVTNTQSQWISAADLTVGDHLWSRTGSCHEIRSITRSHASITVYNLEVESAHTYTVSEHQVLVHNVCKMQPNPDAGGSHTVWKTDNNGNITNHQTFVPNSQNPKGWDPEKRTDLEGSSHFNKVTGEDVPTPHTHDPATPGGVRPATPDETPGSSAS